MKKIAVVPTLLTLGNGVCGFVAITFASKINSGDSSALADINFAIAGWFIMAAMVFDMLDGYIARLSKTASKFGGELDSLCDAISFGVAPAFLLLKIGPGWDRPLLHRFLAGIAALYMVCAILRLARFNVENSPDPTSHKRFRGLPSPGAAGCLASLAILRGAFPGTLGQLWPEANPPQIHDTVSQLVEVIAPVGALVVALLMVSRVPYPHVTKKILRGRRHLGHLIQILLAAFVILLVRELALVVIFWAYALAMPLRYALVRNLRREALPAPDTLPR
ncbi:MAG: CDP-diacylglycerol--serine O-phosphatidyltransferase [Planctomycetes bacterium]|nr:CDP-diacylglycerol--serine O-phosphatidyltransferase [Planctomycetota bacterium]